MEIINRNHNAKEKAIRRRRRHKFTTILYLIGGTALIIGALYLTKKPAPVEFVVDPKTVVYGKTLHAIHEMKGPSINSIAFLPKDGPQPKVAVSTTSYDFGSIHPTEIVSQHFIIQNVGKAPLTISRAYTTCGCTTADFTGTIIPPGENVVMTLVFDAGYHDVRGQIVKRGVIIEINDPNLPQLEIWAEATILES
ncbi:MAG: DUF1573 domain-containing protein [Chloroflexota bacterium]